jgi:hypothetical protein
LIRETDPKAVLPPSQGALAVETSALLREVQQLREEVKQMHGELAQEGVNFKFYGSDKEEIANYTLNGIRRRIAYGDIEVRFRGERGTIVWGG